MQQNTQKFQIAVLDRGFVYIGDCRTEDGCLVIDDARNIRRWGTKNGLGQLATTGPTARTSHDHSGTIRAPIHSVIHLIDANRAAWPTATGDA